MAGSPPPYPPPGAPFGYDPRQQRRFLRDQTRAQMRAYQAANRAQRELYRQQTRGFRRSSILGPLIVIAIGVVFLLARVRGIAFGRFAVWFAHWWPMLLVVAGIVLLIEWAIDQHLATSRGIPVRRGIGAGTVFLLVLIALTGATIGAIHVHRDFLFNNFSINPDNIGDFIGERHDRQQQLDGSAPAGTTIEIDVPHGDVTISGSSSDGQVHVTVDKQIYSLSDSDADAKERDLNATMDLVGQTLRIAVPSVTGSSTDVTISLPNSSQTIVNAGRGSVSVSMMNAPVNVSSDHGDIELQSIAGAVTAHLNNSSSSFHANQIQGQVQLKGRGEDVTITDATGPVSLDGEFYGDTHLEHLPGGLTFRTDRTQFSLGRLEGEVDISPNSELTGSGISGPTILHTRNRNISLDRVAGDLSVVNSNGHVDLISALPLGNISVENHNGDVEMMLPEKSGFSLTAITHGGTIENDLGFTPNVQPDQQTLTGKRGNGSSTINLLTTTADISLHEGAAVAIAPAPPAPGPTPLPAPGKPRKAPATPAVKTETF